MIKHYCTTCERPSSEMMPTGKAGPGPASNPDAKLMGIEHEILQCQCGDLHNWDTLKTQAESALYPGVAW